MFKLMVLVGIILVIGAVMGTQYPSSTQPQAFGLSNPDESVLGVELRLVDVGTGRVCLAPAGSRVSVYKGYLTVLSGPAQGCVGYGH